VAYDYTPDRSAEGSTRILADYPSGFLQSDVYSVYDQLHARGLVEVGCLAHARRQFDEAKTTDPGRAHAALAWIARLYQIEREAKDQLGEAIPRLGQEPALDAREEAAAQRQWAETIVYQRRQEQSRPVVEKFADWLEAVKSQVLPKSPIGEAIGYARSHWGR